MATLLQAYRIYGPQLALKPTAQLEDVAELMAMRIGLNTPEVLRILREMAEIIVYFNKQGRPVRLPSVGIFKPSLRRGGVFHVNLRADCFLRDCLNRPGAYRGVIRNREHIDLDNAGYKVLWDAAHPDDPLEV